MDGIVVLHSTLMSYQGRYQGDNAAKDCLKRLEIATVKSHRTAQNRRSPHFATPSFEFWGGRGRGFKSRHSDQYKPRKYAVSEFSETAYFFVKTRRGHHRGHHVQNDGKSSRFLELANHISARFQRLADVCLNLCLAHLGSSHTSLIYLHFSPLSVFFLPYDEYRI